MTIGANPLRAGAILAIFLSGWVASGFEIRSKRIDDRLYVSMSDVATYYGFDLRRNGRDVHLTGSGRRVSFVLERREGKVDGTQVSLSFAPREHGGQLWFAERDMTLTIDPLLRDWGLPAHNVGRIVLDPGHGGKDRGALGASKQFNEKTCNTLVAAEVAKLLESRGYEVVLTRTQDEYVELTERARRSRAWGGTVFVSIHSNSAAATSASGIETFCLTPKGTPTTGSTKAYASAEKGNDFDALNMRLAWDVQQQLIAATGAVDRGVRRARWAVLKDPGCPAILVECGFLSNREEERNLRNPQYRYNLAVGIANGVLSFHRGVYNGSRIRAGQQ